MMMFTFSQDHETVIHDKWILLDSQCTVDVFQNRDLLHNIHWVPKCMHICCNTGVQSTNLVGALPGYGNVWYDPKGIANILSLRNVKRKYMLPMTAMETEFLL